VCVGVCVGGGGVGWGGGGGGLIKQNNHLTKKILHMLVQTREVGRLKKSI
jgi:hypothetical protein